MNLLVQIFVVVPLLGFLISLAAPARNERLISRVAMLTMGINGLGVAAFAFYWVFRAVPVLDTRSYSVFQSSEYEFFLDFYFDGNTLVFALLGSFLGFLVTMYSSRYLHREKHFKPFFNRLLFFYLGYYLVILAGNLETMFIGWEILGISSFLLIAFYRERYLPVKNSLKVFSLYRIADVGLLLVMWLAHHLFHANVTFAALSHGHLLETHLVEDPGAGLFMALMLLVAAAIKSAQLPFTSWLPRAMEGPTPSSAIFYGSLSVHIGVFLLLRSHPLWAHQTAAVVLVGAVGGLTALVATMIARVQPTVKSQIAYSSAAQIGLMFVELALGFEKLVLVHVVANALLRTYQLLVSPSQVSYQIRDQFYHYQPKPHTFEDSLPRRLAYSLYLLSLKEWNLESFLYGFLWKPLKRTGKCLDFMPWRAVFWLMLPLYGAGVYFAYHQQTVPASVKAWLPGLFALVGTAMVLKAYTERRAVLLSWKLVIMNHCWVALAVAFNQDFDFREIYLYLSGIAVSGLVGYFALRYLSEREHTDLDRFHGHVYEYPRTALVVFLAALGASGFPITPSFVGEDLIFGHIHSDQFGLVFLCALSFVVDGLSLIRIYARVFLGPHTKAYHPIGFKSS
jgi:NADH-quinone oxidoreductase subunit L